MTLTVVPLRDSPTLNDIPAQMRQLADRIESGEVETESVMCIVAVEGDWPNIYGWGDNQGDYGNIGLLEMAKAWFVHHNTTR